MSTEIVNAASLYFNANWQRYRATIEHNTLYHREMAQALSEFLHTHMQAQHFSFVDLGCGDCSTIAPLFSAFTPRHYIGIDQAGQVLDLAKINLTSLSCQKEFIANDIINAVATLPDQLDIIYSSYALHHLSFSEKKNLIANCQKKLCEKGFLLLIDVVKKPGQSRLHWLESLKERMRTTINDLSELELEERMTHPTQSDFPETVDDFLKIAEQQGWKKFYTLFEQDIFAFMVFSK